MWPRGTRIPYRARAKNSELLPVWVIAFAHIDALLGCHEDIPHPGPTKWFAYVAYTAGPDQYRLKRFQLGAVVGWLPPAHFPEIGTSIPSMKADIL